MTGIELRKGDQPLSSIVEAPPQQRAPRQTTPRETALAVTRCLCVEHIPAAMMTQFSTMHAYAFRMPSTAKNYHQLSAASYITQTLLVLAGLSAIFLQIAGDEFESTQPIHAWLTENILRQALSTITLWPGLLGRNIGFARYVFDFIAELTINERLFQTADIEDVFFSNACWWPLDLLAIPGAVMGAATFWGLHNALVAHRIFTTYKDVCFPSELPRMHVISNSIPNNATGFLGFLGGYMSVPLIYLTSYAHISAISLSLHFQLSKRHGLAPELMTTDITTQTETKLPAPPTVISEASEILVERDNWHLNINPQTGSVMSGRSTRSNRSGTPLNRRLAEILSAHSVRSGGRALSTIQSEHSDDEDDDNIETTIPVCLTKSGYLTGYVLNLPADVWISSLKVASYTINDFRQDFDITKHYPRPEELAKEQIDYLRQCRGKPGLPMGMIAGWLVQNAISCKWGVREAWYAVSTADYATRQRRKLFYGVLGLGMPDHDQFRRSATPGYLLGWLALPILWLASVGGEAARFWLTTAALGLFGGQCRVDQRPDYRQSERMYVQIPAGLPAAIVFIPTLMLSAFVGVISNSCRACNRAEKRQIKVNPTPLLANHDALSSVSVDPPTPLSRD